MDYISNLCERIRVIWYEDPPNFDDFPEYNVNNNVITDLKYNNIKPLNKENKGYNMLINMGWNPIDSKNYDKIYSNIQVKTNKSGLGFT